MVPARRHPAPGRPRRALAAALAVALAMALGPGASASAEPGHRAGRLRDGHRPGLHGAGAETLRRQRADLARYAERLRLEAQTGIREQARDGRRRVESVRARSLSAAEREALRRRWRQEDRLDDLASRSDARRAEDRLDARLGPVTHRVFEESELDLRAWRRALDTRRQAEDLAREARRGAPTPSLWQRLTGPFRR